MSPALDSLPTGWYRGKGRSFLSLSAKDPSLRDWPFPDFFVGALLEEPLQEGRVVLVTTRTGRVLGATGFLPGFGMNRGMLEVHGTRLAPREPSDQAMRGLRDAIYWFGALPHVRGTFAEVPDGRLEAACILCKLGYRGEWRKGPPGEGRTRLAALPFTFPPPTRSADNLTLSWPDPPAPQREHDAPGLDLSVHEMDVDAPMQCPAFRAWLGIPGGTARTAVFNHLMGSDDITFTAVGPSNRRSWILISRKAGSRRETWLHSEGIESARHAHHMLALRDTLGDPPNHAWILHRRSDRGGTTALLAGLTPLGLAPPFDTTGAELWSFAI